MMLSRRTAVNLVIMGAAPSVAAAQAPFSVAPANGQTDSTLADVKAFGAVGDDLTDDTAAIQAAADECFGDASRSHSGLNAHLNKRLYFPPGIYKTTAPINLTNVRGGHIFGAGRFATTISNRAGTSVFKADGFEYSRVEMMRLKSRGSSADVFDLDWTHSSGSTALQSNTFADIFFDGGAVGMNIGKSGFMGSENLFLNCFFGPCAVAGIKISNYNALQNTASRAQRAICESQREIEDLGFRRTAGTSASRRTNSKWLDRVGARYLRARVGEEVLGEG